MSYTNDYLLEYNSAYYALRDIKEELEIHNKGQKDDDQNPIYVKNLQYVNEKLRDILTYLEYQNSGIKRFVE